MNPSSTRISLRAMAPALGLLVAALLMIGVSEAGLTGVWSLMGQVGLALLVSSGAP